MEKHIFEKKKEILGKKIIYCFTLLSQKPVGILMCNGFIGTEGIR